MVADWDARAERLTVWDTTQAPVVVRNGLAAMLKLSERQVRVMAPFIGGGLGPKIMIFYPEECCCPGWQSDSSGRLNGSRTAPNISSPPRVSIGAEQPRS